MLVDSRVLLLLLLLPLVVWGAFARTLSALTLMRAALLCSPSRRVRLILIPGGAISYSRARRAIGLLSHLGSLELAAGIYTFLLGQLGAPVSSGGELRRSAFICTVGRRIGATRPAANCKLQTTNGNLQFTPASVGRARAHARAKRAQWRSGKKSGGHKKGPNERRGFKGKRALSAIDEAPKLIRARPVLEVLLCLHWP